MSAEFLVILSPFLESSPRMAAIKTVLSIGNYSARVGQLHAETIYSESKERFKRAVEEEFRELLNRFHNPPQTQTILR